MMKWVLAAIAAGSLFAGQASAQPTPVSPSTNKFVMTGGVPGAAGNGTTDDTTALNAALSAGGIINLECGKNYLVSNLSAPTDATILNGCGPQGAPTQITKKASATGCLITISTNNVSMNNLVLVGVSGNAGNGICVEGRAFRANNVTVKTMGQDGIRVGCDTDGCNANVAMFNNVEARINGRFGFRWHYANGSLPDANAGSCQNCFATFNSSDGFHIDNAWDVMLLNPLADHNGGYAVRFASNARGGGIWGGDLNEADTLGSVQISTGARDQQIYNTNLGTVHNYGSTPFMIPSGANAIAVFGGSNAGGLVVGGTKTSFAFEVTDANSNEGTDTGDFYVDTDNSRVMFGRISNEAGSSTVVRMQGRTGNRVMEWNTTGNTLSYWNPSGSSTRYAIGTDESITNGLTVNNGAYFGTWGTKSTFTAAGFWEARSMTRAQIDLAVPTATGQYIFCSDCTIPGLCVSTGTAAAQWRRDFSATVGCGTNN